MARSEAAYLEEVARDEHAHSPTPASTVLMGGFAAVPLHALRGAGLRQAGEKGKEVIKEVITGVAT